MPRVSVIMPAYNAERYIEEAIESILAQTYRDFELIIVNDGSTDRTEDIILSYSDPRIIYMKNEKNLKISDTLNRGIDVARGEYIARMDADDVALPERFERQVAYMNQHPKCVVCGTAAIVFGENTEAKTVFPSSDPAYVKAQMIFHCPIMHPTAFIRKEILEKENIRYCRDYNGTEDYELWWRLSKYGDICSISHPLLKYRISDNQITRQKGYQQQSAHHLFLQKRMHEWKVDVSEREADIFLNYTRGLLQDMTFEEAGIFLGLLGRITKHTEELFPKNRSIYRHVINDAAFTCIRACSKASKIKRVILFADYCTKNFSVHGAKLLVSVALQRNTEGEGCK